MQAIWSRLQRLCHLWKVILTLANKTSAPNPTFTSASGNKLVDTGKYWSIETSDGTQINTGRKKLKAAKGVLSGFENLETAVEGGATLTDDPLVDMGTNFGTTLSNNQNVDLGKTKKGLATGLMDEYRDYFGDIDSTSDQVALNEGLSSTGDTLQSDGTSNVSDDAAALAAGNAAAASTFTTPSQSGAVTGDGDSVQEIVDFSVLEGQGYSDEEMIQKKQELIAEAERRKQIRQMISRNRLRRFGGLRLLMSQDRFSPGMGVSDFGTSTSGVRFNPREG